MVSTKNQVEAMDAKQETLPDAGPGIESQHAEYLIQRHGTVDLEPVPTMSDTDPYNWPVRKVYTLPIRFSCDSHKSGY